MPRPPIRAATAEDLPRLAEIYRQAIRSLGPAHYSPEQVAMWSAFGEDRLGFAAWIASGTSVVIPASGAVEGFGILQPDGRLAALFVAPEAMRRGHGRTLTTWMLDEARRRGLERVSTEASAFSEPLFQRLGFAFVERETVVRGGVRFDRSRMVYELGAG